MKKNSLRFFENVVLPVVLFALLLASASFANAQNRAKQNSGNEKSILVTAIPHNERTREIAKKLQPSDFVITENRLVQKIVTVKPAADEPMLMAVLIQDDLVSRVNNELEGIRTFIKSLPAGSRVMVGYITGGSLQIRQTFTADKELAADSLRILFSSQTATPYNPYVETIEAIKLFDGEKHGRRMVLLISDGLDTSAGFRFASPFLSIDLDRTISEAQRRAVTIHTIFAPSVGLTGVSRTAANYGQGSLNRLSDETGGEAFFSGMDFVTFDPYFREFNELLRFQWIITYRSATNGKGFRRIQVTTDFDIHLNHAAGYEVK